METFFSWISESWLKILFGGMGGIGIWRLIYLYKVRYSFELTSEVELDVDGNANYSIEVTNHSVGRRVSLNEAPRLFLLKSENDKPGLELQHRGSFERRQIGTQGEVMSTRLHYSPKGKIIVAEYPFARVYVRPHRCWRTKFKATRTERIETSFIP